MSLLKLGGIQIGQSNTASNNFHWRNLLDGLLRLSRGNAGDASPTDVMRVKADDSVEFPGGIANKNQCTAWVNFNGTGTVSIRDSYNVSSITDNGTGDYTVNFASAMLNTNYSVVIGATVGVAGNFMVPGIKSASLGGASVGKTTGGVSVVSVTSSAVDNADFNVVIFGGK